MIYFDQAAAVRPDPAVLNFFLECSRKDFVNQEAAHVFAYQLRGALQEAGHRLALALTGKECFVNWSSSGTDALRTVGMLPRFQKRRAVISAMEHPAGAAAFSGCPDTGSPGIAVYPQVESETGMLCAKPEGVPMVLCDATQAAGKLPLHDAGLIILSGHKLGGMGGAAILYRDESLTEEFLRLRRDHRTGRPEPAQCLALAFAAELTEAKQTENREKVTAINRYLRERLAGMPLPGGGKVQLTLPAENASPYILHLMLPGIQTGVLVRMLGEKGVACSAGSACAAETDAPSPTLLAMGYSRQAAYSGLRLSFGADNTLEEAAEFAAVLEQSVKEY